MIDYKKIIKNRELRLKIIPLLRFMPNEPYLKMVYKIKTGKELNLKEPKTFCEKQNWLKLHNLNLGYRDYVDKIKVRDIVKEKIGEDICFPLLGVYDRYEDIDFNALPEKFVIKCNHDSGSVKVVTDKSKIDHKVFAKFFKDKLKRSSYWDGREYQYKGIKSKIMIEQYMTPDDQEDIEDYKFFCFNGKPEFLFIATDRSTDVKFDFFDMDFNHLPLENIHPMSGKEIAKPQNFEEMKRIASVLSQGIKFVRLDLYSIKDKVYFGEYTFYHGGGFWPFSDEYELKYGEMIDIGNN